MEEINWEELEKDRQAVLAVVQRGETGSVLKSLVVSESNVVCNSCEQGIISRPLSLSVMGTQVVLEMEKRVPCDCYAGRAVLADWHANHCSVCAYGWVVVVPDETRGWERYSEPCTRCDEGNMLSGRISVERAKRSQALLNSLILTPELATKTFDNFQINGHPVEPGEIEALTRAREQVKAAALAGKSLVLIGNTGTGKSHLAAAYLNLCLANGRAGVFVSLIDLMQSLYETISKDSNITWGTALKRYTEADVLVIDDMGQEKATEKTVEVVFHILNHRINNQRTTVVTSNRPLAALRDEKGYSSAIISRLGSYERVIWEVRDWRLR